MTVIKAGGVEALLHRPDPRLRAALVHGPDRAGVGEVASDLLARITPDLEDPFTIALLSETDLDSERVAAELSARSLMGSRRVVRLKLTGELGLKDRVIQEILQSHLEDAYGSDAFLMIESGALDKRSGLRKTAEASDRVASVVLYDDEPVDMGRLAREVLAAAGLRASPAVLSALAQRLPRNRGLARQALESLVQYVGPAKTNVELDDLDQALPTDSGAVGDVAMAAFSGRVHQTVAALARARFAGESGPALIRFLALHRSRLAKARAAIDAGAPDQTAMKTAGVFWKDERDVADQLTLWRRAELEVLQATLSAADTACKTTGTPDELVAHHCALEIALRAGRKPGRSSVA